MNHADVKKKIKEAGAEINHSYVYLLKKDGVVIYVGQSVTVEERITTHRRSGIDFDDFELIKCKKELAGDLEAKNIVIYNPEHNQNLPANCLYIHESKVCGEISKVIRELMNYIPRAYTRKGEYSKETQTTYYFNRSDIDDVKSHMSDYLEVLKQHKREVKQ
jgi:hypothetical protein